MTTYLIIIIGFMIVIALLILRLTKKSKSIDGKSPNLENSLRDERQKSSIILNAIEDGVVLIDKQGIIQLFNPGAASITGWSVDEANNLDYRSVIKLVNEKGETYSDKQNPMVRVSRENQTIRDNNAILITKNNKQIPLSLSLSPLIDSKKEASGIVAIFRDVTQERLEEKQRTEFISTASHEMRTPVAAIEGYLALALNEKVATIDARAKNYLEKAHDSTTHLGKLFQDLLTSAKADDGRLTSHPSVIELGSYLEKIVTDLKFVADKKNIILEYSLSSDSSIIDATSNNMIGSKVIKPFYFVLADPERMREVITNIFDNAVKYTEEGKIMIGLTGDDQVAQVYVKDSGFGIPAEDIPHLFQKFYRVDNSATRTIGGTGLGLYICRKIIELYQGRIWVESKVGKGSTFFINLPRLSIQQAKVEQEKEAAANALNPNATNTIPVIQ